MNGQGFATPFARKPTPIKSSPKSDYLLKVSAQARYSMNALESRIALQSANEAAQAHRSHVLHFIRRGQPLTPSEEALLARFRRIELDSLKKAGVAVESPDNIPVLTDIVHH